MTARKLFDITTTLDDEFADEDGVDRLAFVMKLKLHAKRLQGYSGWNSQCSIERLRELFAEHLAKGDMVDIANFAMMIWNRENPNGPEGCQPGGRRSVTLTNADLLPGLRCALGILNRMKTAVLIRRQIEIIETELTSPEYAKHNPMGGVARMFEAMADRIRAGEDFHEVLDDYNLAPKNP